MTKHVLTLEDFEDGVEMCSTITQLSDEQARDIEYLSRFTEESYKYTILHIVISISYYFWVTIQELRRFIYDKWNHDD